MKKREMHGGWPRQMRDRFLKRLGEVSPLLSILDVAAQRFHQEVESSSSPNKSLRHILSQSGAGKIYLDAGCFPAAIQQLHRAHLAYVIARADQHCRELRDHPNVAGGVRQAVSEHGGDFLRRTIGALVKNRPSTKDIDLPPSEERIAEFLPKMTLALIDYYRLCRNIELHSALDGSKNRADEKYAELPIEKIKSEHKTAPSAPGCLKITDAILCSRVWQHASTCLCRLLIWDELAQAFLITRFSGSPPARRRNGAKQLLRIECLCTESDVDRILNRLGW